MTDSELSEAGTAPTQAVYLIVSAASRGVVADLTKLPRDDRLITGGMLRLICLSPDAGRYDPSGIRIKGAVVTSTLDLRSCEIRLPLEFLDSTFRRRIRLDSATLSAFTLANCSLAGLSARHSTIANGLSLCRSRVWGEVGLASAKIEGDLVCSDATLANPGDVAASADLVEIGGNVLFDGLTTSGAISLRRAKVVGDLDAAGASLRRTKGFALIATGARIGGRVGLDKGFSSKGVLVFAYAEIGSDLDCRGAHFDPDAPVSLIASAATIHGQLALVQVSSGPLDIVGASVAGGIAAMGAELVVKSAWHGDASGNAVAADSIDVGSSIDLRDARVAGTVRLTGAKIGGDLICKGAIIRGGLQRQFDATSLTTPVRHALAAGRAEIGGDVTLNRLQAQGEIRLFRSQIAGDVDLCDVQLTNDYGLSVLAAECSMGRLVMWNAALGGGINLAGARVNTIDDDIADPHDYLGSWGTAEKIVLSGLAYQGFTHGTQMADDHVRFVKLKRFLGQERAIDTWDPHFRFPWLESSQHFDSADWQQLIDTYRASGLEAFAVRAEIERQNDRLRRAGLGRLRWLGRWTLRISIGHGYRSWLAILWAIPIIALFALLVARVPSAFIPTTSASTPAPPPMLYALDTFLPIIDLGVAGKWVVEGWLQWAQTLVIIGGWTLSTLFVAGFTKVVRS